MSELARRRCTNHAQREAAARCPECGRAFCRECVTEFDDRVLCAVCLARQARPSLARRLRLAAPGRVALAAVAFLMLWMMFYGAGRLLLAIPSSIHDGTILVGDPDPEPEP